ncbi:MAG: FAD-dependent protein [Ferruginibacter sp.]
MQKTLSLRLLPADASDDTAIKKKIADSSGKKITEISGYHIIKRSIDARGRHVFINLTLNAFINEPFHKRQMIPFSFKDVQHAAKKVLIIGAGPAGLFAALKLLEAGIQPIILERGKDVRARRRDLALLNKEGIVNPESNYCFGEGGAGTYSDGKLYTRSNKRGDIQRILNLFVHFGASEHILYDAHPHIGTNKLPAIITAMRQCICYHGGKVLFEKKVVDLILENGAVRSVQTANREIYTADEFILATGHSARDIFELFLKKNILIEAKPFALGVRVEHPQSLIDTIQYHCDTRDELLPPASYSLVQQVNEKGVFSFCMCPGGIIAPAATDPGELVVNGWSPSKRNNPYANSGMVVQVTLHDAMNETKHLKLKENDPLLFMHFQKMIEQKAFNAGGGKFVAPATRMVDFTGHKISTTLPANSYLPGLESTGLENVLPGFIYDVLANGFLAFGKKMKGYFTNEAVVVATESRTSSPVRIPRHTETFAHPQYNNLYPCGEGAGYAGGIVSAAMDGENVAARIVEKLLV